MAFTIVLQRNESETNKVDKSLTDLLTLSGTLRAECSIIDPTFQVEADLANLTGCNYCTVSSFGRSYFVRNIVSVRAGLVELVCHVDVLSSFKAQLRANRGVIRRSESGSLYNLNLNDGSLVAYQDPFILTEPFPAGFDGNCFILAVASGG